MSDYVHVIHSPHEILNEYLVLALALCVDSVFFYLGGGVNLVSCCYLKPVFVVFLSLGSKKQR